MANNFYPIAFKITGVLNIVAALAALVSMSSHLEMFYGDVHVDPALRFYHYCFWFIVLLFGVGYFFLASDPERFYPIALIGGLAKLFIAAGWLHMFSGGAAKTPVVGGAVYDIVSGLILLAFFVTAKKKSPTS